MLPVTLFAPAKLNLGLRVTGRYANGYHHLESLFVPITLYDRLELKPGVTWAIHHVWQFANNCLQAKNLASGVLANPLLWKSIATITGSSNQISPDSYGNPQPCSVTVYKRIPSPSGLGGASADAAALIAYLIGLSGSRQASAELLQETSRLGADIPYFLQYGLWGEAAYLSGVGAQLKPVTLPQLAGIVAVPPFGFSTRAMFDYFRACNLPIVSEDYPPQALQSKSALRLSEIPDYVELYPGVRMLRNDFEQAATAVFPKEAQLLSVALAKVAQSVRQFFSGTWFFGMTGSGPALYAVTEAGPATANLKRLAAVLKHRLGTRWEVYTIRSHHPERWQIGP